MREEGLVVRNAGFLCIAICGASAVHADFVVSDACAVKLERTGPQSARVVGRWAFDGVQGWSWGVCHYPADVRVGDCADREPPEDPCDGVDCPYIECPADLLTCRQGGPPAYYAVNVLEEGVIQGVLIDFRNCCCLEATDRFEMLEIFYTFGRGFAALRFCDILGDPAIPVAFAVGGRGYVPRRQEGLAFTDARHYRFIRGDVNLDGRVGIADFSRLTKHLTGTHGLLPCADAGDVNDDGRVDVLDGLVLARLFFDAQGYVPDPFSACGIDLTEDPLTCETLGACGREQD